MKKELWFYRFLRWVGLTKAYGVDKKEMCEKAKSVCNMQMGCPHSLFAGRFAIELPKFMKDKFMKEYCFVSKIESYKE